LLAVVCSAVEQHFRHIMLPGRLNGKNDMPCGFCSLNSVDHHLDMGFILFPPAVRSSTRGQMPQRRWSNATGRLLWEVLVRVRKHRSCRYQTRALRSLYHWATPPISSLFIEDNCCRYCDPAQSQAKTLSVINHHRVRLSIQSGISRGHIDRQYVAKLYPISLSH
jgi:hypothetical protein